MKSDSISISWEKIEALFDELIALQQKTLLKSGQQIIPNITQDDLLQPNDFLKLEHHPLFRYEEGVLAGLQTVQMALLALKKEIENDPST